MKRVGLFAIFGLALALASAPSALGCSACFGQSDSAMARSLNASIFTLMGIIGTVLVGAASFFVFLARRAATNAQTESSTNSSSQPQSQSQL
jgi:heme/copper-type cytochrome/quinol oxidase subunit 2